MVFLAREDLVQIVLHFENLWLWKVHLPRKQRLSHKNLAKISKKTFPFITNIHIPSMSSFHNAYLVHAHAQMLIFWTFWWFSTHTNAYFQLQSVNCCYFWPIRLNEPKKCLYLFQRISVNRKPNKWLNQQNRIFSKICWQDFIKYIYFEALHIQNNCAKFQIILPKGYG